MFSHEFDFSDEIITLTLESQRRVVSEEVVVGTKMPGGGGRGRLYLTRHCHHHNDFFMGSDESHFNVSFVASGIVTRRCPQTTTFQERESRSEVPIKPTSSAYSLNALPLGQIARLVVICRCILFAQELTETAWREDRHVIHVNESRGQWCG